MWEGVLRVLKTNQLCYAVVLLLWICIATGCNKNIEVDTLQVEDNSFEYKEENISSYTVDGNGLVYISSLSGLGEENTSEEISIDIHVYNLNGTLLDSYNFYDTISSITAMTVNETTIYFTIQVYNGNYSCVNLYSFHIESQELELMVELEKMETVERLVFLDGSLYIFGKRTYALNQNPSDGSYQSEGEQILRYALEENQLYELAIKYPISMSLNEVGTLMVYAYGEQEGFCMLEYNPHKDTLKVIAKYETNKFQNFAACDSGKRIIYTYNKNSRGLVMSDVTNINEEAELLLDANVFHSELYYVKGQVFCMNQDRNIVRFALDTNERNKTLQYISLGYEVDAPYGCGYYMERKELEEDKFALKVLAQDKDYDLGLMNSLYGSSYNIQKNGVFYPLNHVEGIDEYLNACFPYVKEAATNEDGDIWMIPIGVDIPSLLVNEQYLNEYGILMNSSMTYEDFYQVQEQMNEELYGMVSCNSYVIYSNFFKQYFNQYTSLNQDSFLNHIKLFQKYDSKVPEQLNFNIDWNGKFLFNYAKQQSMYEFMLREITQREGLRFNSMPKLNAKDPNIGTCFFLAVNPNSDRLEDTLDFISSWIAYTLQKEETPYFFQSPVPEEGTLEKSLYDLYANGEIAFSLDSTLYWEGFEAVIENKMDIKDFMEETQRKLDVYFNE